jgi:hypothetical protein
LDGGSHRVDEVIDWLKKCGMTTEQAKELIDRRWASVRTDIGRKHVAWFEQTYDWGTMKFIGHRGRSTTRRCSTMKVLEVELSLAAVNQLSFTIIEQFNVKVAKDKTGAWAWGIFAASLLWAAILSWWAS